MALYIRNVYYACLAHALIPINWRNVKVVFIPKPEKPFYTNARNSRPISLTPFPLKGLEEQNTKLHTFLVHHFAIDIMSTRLEIPRRCPKRLWNRMPHLRRFVTRGDSIEWTCC